MGDLISFKGEKDFFLEKDKTCRRFSTEFVVKLQKFAEKVLRIAEPLKVSENFEKKLFRIFLCF